MTGEVSIAPLLIFSTGGLEPQIVRAYAAQLVYVLDHLQRLDIMHRDLKPPNILLDDEFNLKVVSIYNSSLNLDFRLTLVKQRRNLKKDRIQIAVSLIIPMEKISVSKKIK